MNKNDAWKHIFIKLSLMQKIKDTGYCILSADDIKDCNPRKNDDLKSKKSQFEPRLLCSQNTENERPLFFKNNSIYIFPIKNGIYYLCNNNIFFPLEYKKKKITYLENDTSSVLLNVGKGETSIINKLIFSKLFENDEYLGEKITHINPLSGRHYTCSFQIKLEDKKIDICSVQYEIDTTLESKNKIILIECKNTSKKIKAFNIRQLYFPYRQIYENIKNKEKKEIIPLYIHNIGDKIYIWKFKFEDYKKINSIKCISYNIYKFYKDDIISDDE